MKSIYSQFKMDGKLEQEGIWLEYGQLEDGTPIRVKIARAGGGNIAFNKALEKATRPHKKALQHNALDSKVAERIYREVFADTVILDWQGITGQNGEMIPFNRENVLKVLEDLPEFFSDLREQAHAAANYRLDELEGDLKNSGRSCSTDSSKDQ